MSNIKTYVLQINGVDVIVKKQVFELVSQLIQENKEMVDLLNDAYYLNKSIDNKNIVYQQCPMSN